MVRKLKGVGPVRKPVGTLASILIVTHKKAVTSRDKRVHHLVLMYWSYDRDFFSKHLLTIFVLGPSVN